jgi:hypothetical protein
MSKTKVPVQAKKVKIAKKKAKQAPKKNTPGQKGRTSARQRLVTGDTDDADEVQVAKKLKRQGTSCREKTMNKLVKVAAEEKRGSKNKAVQLKSLGLKKRRKVQDGTSISSHSGVPHSQSEPQSEPQSLADAVQGDEASEGDEEEKLNKKIPKQRMKRLSAGWGYASTVLGSNRNLNLVRYFSYFIYSTCILTQCI